MNESKEKQNDQCSQLEQSENSSVKNSFYIEGRAELLQFQPFIEAVKIAISREFPSLTNDEYQKLQNAFFASRPCLGSRMGWFYCNRSLLQQVLKENGILEILKDPISPLHDYSLNETGISRLSEIEIAINRKLTDAT